MSRRVYQITPIRINGKIISEVVIDSHYEQKHSSYMNDELILELVKYLNERVELPADVDNEYRYFATLLEHKEKQYRLIWLLEKNSIYIGIINAYRDNRKE